MFFPFILSTCYFSSAANPENPPIQGAVASSLHFWRTNEGKYQLQRAQSQHVSASLQVLHLYFLPSKRPSDGWGSNEELDWLSFMPPPILHPTARTDRPAWGRGAKHRPVWEHLSWVSTSNQRRAPRRCHLNAGRRRGWMWYILSHNPSSWCERWLQGCGGRLLTAALCRQMLQRLEFGAASLTGAPGQEVHRFVLSRLFPTPAGSHEPSPEAERPPTQGTAFRGERSRPNHNGDFEGTEMSPRRKGPRCQTPPARGGFADDSAALKGNTLLVKQGSTSTTSHMCTLFV